MYLYLFIYIVFVEIKLKLSQVRGSVGLMYKRISPHTHTVTLLLLSPSLSTLNTRER